MGDISTGAERAGAMEGTVAYLIRKGSSKTSSRTTIVDGKKVILRRLTTSAVLVPKIAKVSVAADK